MMLMLHAISFPFQLEVGAAFYYYWPLSQLCRLAGATTAAPVA